MKRRNHKRNEQEMIRFMMPVYYIPETLTSDELQDAKMAWELILHDQSPQYLKRKSEEPNFPYNCCVTFFYDSFYARLFDMHPTCRPMFKNGMKAQGRFLVKMITLALSEYDDPEKFEQTLVKLAEVHYHRGVKAVECKKSCLLYLYHFQFFFL